MTASHLAYTAYSLSPLQNHQLVEGFETMPSKDAFILTATYRTIAWEIVSHPGALIIVFLFVAFPH